MKALDIYRNELGYNFVSVFINSERHILVVGRLDDGASEEETCVTFIQKESDKALQTVPDVGSVDGNARIQSRMLSIFLKKQRYIYL